MSLPVPLGELWSRTSCWFQTTYPQAPSVVPLDVSAQTTQPLSNIAQGCSAQPSFSGCPSLHRHGQGSATDTPHFRSPCAVDLFRMPPLPLPLPPGPSSSLDISSCPLTPFPAPTLTPQPLFWPVSWTHRGLGVGQWSLFVKSEHYWVPDMCDSTHKHVYTHMCVYTHARVHRAACSVVSDVKTIFCDKSLQ